MNLRVPLFGLVALSALAGILAASASGGGSQRWPTSEVLSAPRNEGIFPALRASGDVAGPADGDSPLAPPNLQKAKELRMSSHVARLARAGREAGAAGQAITARSLSRLEPDLQAMADARLMRVDGRGRVQVYVLVATTADEVMAEVERANGEVERVDEAAGTVQALVPIGQLEALAARPSVRFVRLPDYGFSQAGSVTTEGDSILGADSVRSAYAVDGTGVKVGVISDGVGGLTSSQASGDLPAVDTSTCNVVGQDPAASGAEGTAILEIVHDVAPGAELWFGNFGFGTSLDFNAAVDCLAANTDVVVDDIGWFNVGPYDGTSSVSANTSTELNRASNPIRAYATSVANMADGHYEEAYAGSGFFVGDLAADFWVLQRFQATADTTDAGQGLACDVGVFCGDSLLVAPGGIFTVLLQWDDPFGNSSNDYDLLVFDEFGTGSLYLTSASIQSGPGFDPVEAFAFENTHGVTTFFDILIGNYLGAAASRTFDMFVICSGCSLFPNGAVHNFNTAGSSVPNQSDSGGGVMSIGAINASDPGNDDIAFYSSRGPTNDGRLKPDITGIDGVSVTGAGGFPTPFFGTSAASPHIGGIAALLLECNPWLLAGEPGDSPSSDRTALRDALQDNAADLGSPGADNTYGYGRADAAASAAPVCDPDGDGIANASDPDDDGDGYYDDDETEKGSIPIDAGSTPEHCDGVDNDGDTAVDEEPAGADWDIDGDTVKDCLDADVDTDGDGVVNTVDDDDDGDGITDADELFMSSDELGNCPTSDAHDAWAADRDRNGLADIGDVIANFMGRIFDPAAYDARSDADASGEIDVGDVISLHLGRVFTKCAVFTFSNSTGGDVDDIHIEWGRAVAEVFSALDSDLEGWSDRTLSEDGLTLDIARPDAQGDLASGGQLAIVVRGQDPQAFTCQWTLDGVDEGAC